MAQRLSPESRTSTLLLALSFCAAVAFAACTNETGGNPGGQGGSSSGGASTAPASSGGANTGGANTGGTNTGGTNTGGTIASSGGANSGGTTASSGGTIAKTGGTTASSGGTVSSGGVTSSGGTTRTGGGASSGGVISSGGTAQTGGSSASGGSSGGTTKMGGSTAAGGSAGGTTGTGGTSGGGSVAGLPAAADILATLKLVIPYEIKLGPEDPSWVNKWTEATFYIGVMAAYLATNDQTYLTDATNWGTKNNWTLLASPTRSADNQCAGQVYEDIYLANSATATANMYASTKTSIDLVKASPKPGIVQNTDDWWWCDALFMAPGGVVRLGKITGDSSYYSLLDTEWTATQNGLFDKATGLFWRDSSYVNKTTYWSRGNGWVMGGIVRVLEYLPTTDANYNSYVTLLKTMAAAVLPYQQSDGTWHSDLTHPTTYNNPEVSGTGLMTYAIAWGINQGLLDKAT